VDISQADEKRRRYAARQIRKRPFRAATSQLRTSIGPLIENATFEPLRFVTPELYTKPTAETEGVPPDGGIFKKQNKAKTLPLKRKPKETKSDHRSLTARVTRFQRTCDETKELKHGIRQVSRLGWKVRGHGLRWFFASKILFGHAPRGRLFAGQVVSLVEWARRPGNEVEQPE
jgi:hypothetical protein